MLDLSAWWDRLSDALQHPAFHAAFLALLIGLALTEGLAHLIPRLQRKTAERVIRWFVLFAVTTIGFYLHKTTIGAGWALFAGLAAPSIHHSLQSYVYARWPTLRPKALR